MPKFRCMAWNVGFSSRKTTFLDDQPRAEKIIDIVSQCKPEIVALDEMANRKYDDRSFSLEEFIRREDTGISSIHFEPALSLGTRHSNPLGKHSQLRRGFGILEQEQGLGIWVRRPMVLGNLHSLDRGDGRVEVSRPLPHPLYMGARPTNEKEDSAGRDEEDRPVLWCRFGEHDRYGKLVYFASLHLPTLKNEEKFLPERQLNSRQKEILGITLGLPDVQHVDQLGTELRVYFLRHLISQANRIEAYWKDVTECVFIYAGDFNFEHRGPSAEKAVLTKAGFQAAKQRGCSRPGGRLVDNIWVGGGRPEEITIEEVLFEAKRVEDCFSPYLDEVSDHYPVVADVSW